MVRRRHIGLTTKLASALLALGHVPHAHAQEMTANQIISLFAWDHYPVPVAHGGTDHPSNLVPLLIAAHRTKTAKSDAPMMAKVRHVTKKHEEFRRRLLAREPGKPREKRGKIPSRPMRRKKK